MFYYYSARIISEFSIHITVVLQFIYYEVILLYYKSLIIEIILFYNLDTINAFTQFSRNFTQSIINQVAYPVTLVFFNQKSHNNGLIIIIICNCSIDFYVKKPIIKIKPAELNYIFG